MQGGSVMLSPFCCSGKRSIGLEEPGMGYGVYEGPL